MKAFYSLLWIQPNTTLGDRIALGLFVWDEHEFLFQFSETKLKIIEQLFSKETYALLKAALRSIEHSSVRLVRDRSLLFGSDAAAYFNYLSRYANNLLAFNAPTEIRLPANAETFKFLYQNYIGVPQAIDQATPNKQKDLRTIVQKKLYPQIKDAVNFGRELTPRDIPALITPIKPAFIGQNERTVCGHLIDFTHRINDLSANVNRLLILKNALAEKRQEAIHFVAVRPPQADAQTEAADVWARLQDKKFTDVQFISEDKLDTIVRYIEAHQVKPYFPQAND